MTMIRRFGDCIWRVAIGLYAELGRLNRYSVDPAPAAGVTRRERARMVAAALERRYRTPTRCC